MAAAPQNATLFARGRSGKIYTVDVYLSDVANAQGNMNPSGAAGTGSLQYWRPEEDIKITDFSIVTGMTDTKGVNITYNGAIGTGRLLRYANQLNTLATRGSLNLFVPAGTLIGMIQFA